MSDGEGGEKDRNTFEVSGSVHFTKRQPDDRVTDPHKDDPARDKPWTWQRLLPTDANPPSEAFDWCAITSLGIPPNPSITPVE